MESTLTRKGQTTIPAGARRKLGWRPGGRIVWTVEGGRLVGRAAKDSAVRSSLEKLSGRLKHPRWKGNTDEWLKGVRGA